MYLEIVSPQTTLFSGKVNSVTVPGVNGSFQMLNYHAPIVSLLKSGIIKIYGNIVIEKQLADKFTSVSDSETTLPIDGGTVEMKNNKVIILAD